MTIPRHHQQMTKYTLDIVKGDLENPLVDYSTKFDPTQLAALADGIAKAGRCVHLNASGYYEYGAEGWEMPMWLRSNSDDPTVDNPGGDPATEPMAWKGTQPTGAMPALTAAGAYELKTTEFDTTASYAINDPLYAETDVAVDNRGKLTKTAVGGAYPATSVVGIVSRTQTPTTALNSHFRPFLCFWPRHYPAHAHAE